MRALILRRVGLIERGAGGPVIVGQAENGDVVRLDGFLSRNGYPHLNLDPDKDPEARALLEFGSAPAFDTPRFNLPALRRAESILVVAGRDLNLRSPKLNGFGMCLIRCVPALSGAAHLLAGFLVARQKDPARVSRKSIAASSTRWALSVSAGTLA